jgi:hypothetical protein
VLGSEAVELEVASVDANHSTRKHLVHCHRCFLALANLHRHCCALANLHRHCCALVNLHRHCCALANRHRHCYALANRHRHCCALVDWQRRRALATASCLQTALRALVFRFRFHCRRPPPQDHGR